MSYIADTNIYVAAANDGDFRVWFATFMLMHGPLLISSVVIAEILIGIPDTRNHDATARALTAGADPLAPTPAAWRLAAHAIARLGGDQVTKSRSFWNDALLAAQCSEMGATLLTSNTADFRRLGRYIAIDIVAPE